MVSEMIKPVSLHYIISSVRPINALISIKTAFTICTFTMDQLGTFNVKKVVIRELAVLLNFMESFSIFQRVVLDGQLQLSVCRIALTSWISSCSRLFHEITFGSTYCRLTKDGDLLVNIVKRWGAEEPNSFLNN